MQLDAYLAHLGYSGPKQPTVATLTALQQAHLHRVPFENLSVHAHEEIRLDPTAFYDKIVNRHRGGFCYELNGLFAELLHRLGFQVHYLSAGVADSNGSFGPLHDHLLLRVDLAGGSMLVDVGFGEQFRTPMPMVLDAVHREPLLDHRLRREGDFLVLDKRLPGQHWEPSFRFPERTWDLADFADMCHHHQTSPESSFTRRLTCSLARPGGRITLAVDKLIVTHGGERRETPVTNHHTWHALLREHFGMVAPAGLRFPEPLTGT